MQSSVFSRRLGPDGTALADSDQANHRRSSHDGPNNISSYLHRIGYHFKSEIFDEACNWLGYRMQNNKLVRDSEPTAALGFERAMARQGLRAGQSGGENATAEDESKVKMALKELFPKIPDHSLNEIFRKAWKQVRRASGASRSH